MKKIINFIEKKMPSPPLKIVADRLFIISIVSLSLGGFFFNEGEGFICLLSSLLFYLSNLKFNTKKRVLSNGIRLFLLSIISVLLGTINPLYIPLVTPVYTFFLVIFERDKQHRKLPMFFLPLGIHLMSVGFPLDFIFQRVGSIFIGIIIALVAKFFIWPSKGDEEIRSGKENFFSSLNIKYTLRKSIGIALVIIIGKFIGVKEGVPLFSAYLFLILHSPIDTEIFPKVSKRIWGTILGGLFYLPLTYFIESKILIYILSFGALYLIFIFMGQCYVTTVTFITLNALLSSVGVVSFETILSQRFLFVILGGGIALAISLLIPLKEEFFIPMVK